MIDLSSITVKEIRINDSIPKINTVITYVITIPKKPPRPFWNPAPSTNKKTNKKK